MRVVASSDSGSSLAEKYRQAGGFTLRSSFDLIPAKEYLVYGLSIWRGLLFYLIEGEGRRPAWYPADLFRVTQSELPSNWHFVYFGQEATEVSSIWGYDELINDEAHYDELANLEPRALEIFERRKGEHSEAS